MKQSLRILSAILLTSFSLAANLWADEPRVRVTVPHVWPSNVLPDDKPVKFTADVSVAVEGQGQLEASVVDYFGQEQWRKTLPLHANASGSVSLPLEIGKIERGYHDLKLTATFATNDGQKETATTTTGFGIAPLVNRTAAEARAANSRFGVKTWGVDDIWWKRPLKWDLGQVVDACSSLGLQWTRHQFNEKDQKVSGVLSTNDLLKHQVNVVLKVEGFPVEFYDASRYGPLEQYEAKHGKSSWYRLTVPMKGPYQTWLAGEIQKLPASQNVFEIWNEPWGKMTPEEFAEICQMAEPVIRKVRPDAIIGPNTALGPIEWERRFIKAGGLEGMNMLTVHPYSFTPPPEQRTRVSLRNYHDFLRKHAGRDFDLYTTEYGWSVAPQAEKAVPERQQAQRTVRQSLLLYAEDIKTLIPHWMGDREQDPKDMDQWFGFFRLIGEPRPVVFAFATCARMIDSSRFVGDLAYGPGTGAMLFERGGVFTVALWNLEENAANAKPLTIDTASKNVTVVDFMGRETPTQTADGKITLNVSSDVMYVVGVDPSLEKQVILPSQELDPDQWVQRQGETQTLTHAKTAPKIDGDLADWPDTATRVELSAPNVEADDCHATVSMMWDAQSLYLAVRVSDSMIVTGNPSDKKAKVDRLEVSFGTRPSRQLHLSGWNLFDYTIAMTPTTETAPATLTISNDDWPTPKTITASGNESSGNWATRQSQGQWTAEIAIPFRTLGDFTPQSGSRLSWLTSYTDVDAGGASRRVSSSPAELPIGWPYLELRD